MEYALNVFNMTLTVVENDFEVKYKINEIEKSTNDKLVISKVLKDVIQSIWENEILNRLGRVTFSGLEMKTKI